MGIQHDATGNQTAIGGYSFTFDAENRLATSTINSATTTDVYDGEGRRVKKVNPDQSQTVYVYNAMGQLAAEYASNPPAGGETIYLTADHLGSTRVATSATGTTLARRDYLPFGEEIPSGIGSRTSLWSADMGAAQKFTGKERDTESGLDYFGARYFSGAQGRFTTADPLMASGRASNPQTWNRYAYALNNPLRYVDPDGMEVPDSCVKDPKCTIVVKVKAIYDSTAKLTPQQKKDFEKRQIETAKKDYGVSNIRLDVTYSEAKVTTSGGIVYLSPEPDASTLNVVASTWTPTGERGASGVDPGTDVAYSFIDMNRRQDDPSFFFTNTTTHELGHQFLGHGYLPQPFFFEKWLKEHQVDSRVRDQSAGKLQQDFREGLKQRQYAVPSNPEANKPRQ